MNQHFGKETGTQGCQPSDREPAMTAGNQDWREETSAGESNQNPQTANDD